MSGGLLVDLLVDVDKHRVKEMVEKLILLCKDVPAIFIVFIACIIPDIQGSVTTEKSGHHH